MSPVYFYILIRSWKAFDNFDRCLNSVFIQTYNNYKILFVDDASPLNKKQRMYIKDKLKKHVVVFNNKRLYSIRNAYEIIHKYAKNHNAVIFNLDGDDWLPHSKCLQEIVAVYQNNPICLVTWGECFIWDGNKLSRPSRHVRPNTNLKYPNIITRKNNYRKYAFLPLHPRTWKVSLFKKIKKKDFLRPNGSWLQFAEDQAIFYPMLEMAAGRYSVLNQPIYVYNTGTNNSDAKRNFWGLLKDELIIRKKKQYEPII